MAQASDTISGKSGKTGNGFLDRIKNILRKNQKLTLFLLSIKWRFKFGKAETKRLRKEYIACNVQPLAVKEKTYLSKEEYQAQQETMFPEDVRISVVVPLFNTPAVFLKRMIDSVRVQSYTNWELCLADGSDEKYRYVKRICLQYSEKDKRIRYQKLKNNLGISGNSNACIEMATGDYIALLDHDDELHPAAFYEVVKVICEKKADFIYTDETGFHKKTDDAYNSAHFKPDYAPDTLRSYNYICHLTVFRKDLLEKAGGGFRTDYDGSQDYDIILRLTEVAEKIVHIPKILYFWRSHKKSTAADISAKPYAVSAGKKALAEHLKRSGLHGTIEDGRLLSHYRIRYDIDGMPLISIIIPNKDHIEDLDKCITSVREKTTWKNWEIIIAENNSRKQETFAYYQAVCVQDSRVKVVTWNKEFNFSAICNFGAEHAAGKYLLFLNNDMEVITPDWIEEMLMFAQRKDVGAVGAMLFFPDDTIQHAGVIVGIGGSAAHSHRGSHRGEYGYASRLALVQNLSAVTGACMMVRKSVFDEVEGFDEEYPVALNDVDLCLTLRKAGYLIVWTPFAELYHYESKSRGYDDTEEKQIRFSKEKARFNMKWGRELAEGDPYYNPNLTIEREDFSIRV